MSSATRTAPRTGVAQAPVTALRCPSLPATAPHAAGIPLPSAARRRFERLFDACLADVRVHVGSAPLAIGARAFAFGPDLFVAPGEYDPASPRGRQLLGHELAHVLQQRAGRAPSATPDAVLVDVALEHEAERAGNAVARGLAVEMPGASGHPRRRRDDLALRSVQPCFYCGDLTCLKGEKCKQNASLGGLFPPGTSSPYVGPHKETKKHSSRGEIESEHTFPGAALRKAGMAHNLQTEPTISIPYDMHRGGVSGAGGGISSTGSSGTSQGWSTHLADLARGGNMVEAIRQAAVDGINSAAVQGLLTEGMLSGYMQVVNGHAMNGRITQAQAGEINNSLYNMYLGWKGRGMAT